MFTDRDRRIRDNPWTLIEKNPANRGDGVKQ